MIFREYGSSVIAALVAGMLFCCISGMGNNSWIGLPERLGSYLQITSHDTLKATDSPAFERYQSEVVPGMKYNQDKIIYNGVEVRLKEYFSTEDASASYTVKGIRNIRDVVWTTLSGDNYLFAEPGIYQVFLESKNSGGKKKQCVISFPVLEKQEEL